MPKVDLIRKVSFSSGHRFWFASLSDDENRALFGKWASPYNHGHNYVLELTARGEVDLSSGMVVNIKLIDDVLQERVVQRFGRKSINDEVAGFADRTPCLENLLLYFRDELRDLPGGAELVALRLEELQDFYGEWTKDGDKVTIGSTDYVVSDIIVDTSFVITEIITGLDFTGDKYEWEPFKDIEPINLGAAWL